MGKTLKVFIMSFVFLALCSVTGYYTKFVTFPHIVIPLVVALGILFFSGILSLIGKKNIYIK